MIYRILANPRKYLMLSFGSDYMLKSVLAGKSISNDPSPVAYSEDWEPTEVKFVDGYPENKEEKKQCDILYDMGHLFLSDKAAEILKPYLTDGELLAVTYADNNGYIFNPLKLIGANAKLSTVDKNGDIASLVFDEEAAIFKTEYDGYHGVFCNEEFKGAVESAGLAGAYFEVDLSSIFVTEIQSAAH